MHTQGGFIDTLSLPPSLPKEQDSRPVTDAMAEPDLFFASQVRSKEETEGGQRARTSYVQIYPGVCLLSMWGWC